MAAVQTAEQTTFAILDGHQYMNLTTYRKNGTEVTRPVWFAEDNGTIYAISVVESGKVKHIRNNPDVFVSPCDARGNPLSEERAPGTATLHEKGSPTAEHANDVLNRKYGLIKRLFSLSFIIRRAEVVWIEIQPRN